MNISTAKRWYCKRDIENYILVERVNKVSFVSGEKNSLKRKDIYR